MPNFAITNSSPDNEKTYDLIRPDGLHSDYILYAMRKRF